MAMIDIRSDREEKVVTIAFADESNSYCNAQYLVKYPEVIQIEDADSSNCLSLCRKEDAENLIKALKKAIDLDWWKV